MVRARVDRSFRQRYGVVHDEYLGGVANIRRKVVEPFLGENDDAVGPAEELAHLGAVVVISILEERCELAVMLMQDYMFTRLVSHSGKAVLAIEAAAHRGVNMHDVSGGKFPAKARQGSRKSQGLLWLAAVAGGLYVCEVAHLPQTALDIALGYAGHAALHIEGGPGH